MTKKFNKCYLLSFWFPVPSYQLRRHEVGSDVFAFDCCQIVTTRRLNDVVAPLEITVCRS